MSNKLTLSVAETAIELGVCEKVFANCCRHRDSLASALVARVAESSSLTMPFVSG